mgnify:CR=1 FL=1
MASQATPVDPMNADPMAPGRSTPEAVAPAGGAPAAGAPAPGAPAPGAPCSAANGPSPAGVVPPAPGCASCRPIPPFDRALVIVASFTAALAAGWWGVSDAVATSWELLDGLRSGFGDGGPGAALRSGALQALAAHLFAPVAAPLLALRALGALSAAVVALLVHDAVACRSGRIAGWCAVGVLLLSPPVWQALATASPALPAVAACLAWWHVVLATLDGAPSSAGQRVFRLVLVGTPVPLVGWPGVVALASLPFVALLRGSTPTRGAAPAAGDTPSAVGVPPFGAAPTRGPLLAVRPLPIAVLLAPLAALFGLIVATLFARDVRPQHVFEAVGYVLADGPAASGVPERMGLLAWATDIVSRFPLGLWLLAAAPAVARITSRRAGARGPCADGASLVAIGAVVMGLLVGGSVPGGFAVALFVAPWLAVACGRSVAALEAERWSGAGLGAASRPAVVATAALVLALALVAALGGARGPGAAAWREPLLSGAGSGAQDVAQGVLPAGVYGALVHAAGATDALREDAAREDSMLEGAVQEGDHVLALGLAGDVGRLERRLVALCGLSSSGCIWRRVEPVEADAVLVMTRGRRDGLRGGVLGLVAGEQVAARWVGLDGADVVLVVVPAAR